MAGMEDIIGKTGNYNVRDKFKRFDNRFIRPYLIRDLKVGVSFTIHIGLP
jgi:solute carrier family 9 (sodium/hydrogen exchanger), member 3